MSCQRGVRELIDKLGWYPLAQQRGAAQDSSDDDPTDTAEAAKQVTESARACSYYSSAGTENILISVANVLAVEFWVLTVFLGIVQCTYLRFSHG